MNKSWRHVILMFFSLLFGLLYFWHDTAEAARMGRGRSFGSKPTYQRKAAPSESGGVSQSTPGLTAQPRSPAGAQPSGMRRWGGMLGGMLMGGLIGSLLFGGASGFGGPGLLDLLLVGGGLFLLFRFLRARRMAAESSAGGVPFERSSSQTWQRTEETIAQGEAVASEVQHKPLPPGFDAADFLKGANAIYVRLQTAWDKRDLNDIHQFTSPEVFAEIQQQAQEDPLPGKTELLLITPSITAVREEGNQIIVSVLYDVMLRENAEGASQQVRELWHFSRERDKPQDFWLLEGIQQVE